MRDILDMLDFLVESKGLVGRKAGDVFKNPQGETITFNNLDFFPEGGGKYTAEEMQEVLSQVEAELSDIIWQNTRSAKSGGFAVATFDSEQGPLYFGTFLQEVKPNPSDNQIKNTVGDFKLASASAEKTQAKLTPQDLLTEKLNLSAKDVMIQLSQSLGTDSPLYYVAHQVAMNSGFPIEIDAPEGSSFTAFRDYFCEILQPIALQNGMFTGNATDAAEKFLGINSFAGTTISFDSSKNAGLSDSVLETSDGRHVKISSKGEKGADASSKNLLDEIDKIQDPRMLKKYSDIIEMIELIVSSGQAGAPLVLGVRFGIISDEDAETIKGLKKLGPTDLSSLKGDTMLSSNLKKLALGRSTKTPQATSLYYHIMAAVAHEVAEKVNSGTNFNEAACNILNNGALVQVYTKAKQSGGKWILEGFDSKYPSKSVTGVVLTATKNYYSTDIKGNFTFKILRNGAKDVVDTKDQEPVETEPSVDLTTAAQSIVSPRRLEKPTAVGVGRKKR